MKTVEAKDYCSFVTDGTHDSPKPQTEGRYLVTSKHLNRFQLDFQSANFISEEDFQKIIVRSSVEQWDILFSMIGTIGNIYIETNPTVEYACKNMGIFKMGGDSQKAKWLFYYLQSPKAKEYIAGVARGTTQGYVPLGALRTLPIEVPSDDEREKIVQILWNLDKKILINQIINKNLEQQAALIFNNWLCHCTDSTTIGNLSNNILDYTPVAKKMIRLLNSSDVTDGIFTTAPLVPNVDLKGHFKKRFQFGDILYSEIRPRNHHHGFVLFDASDYIASTRLMVIRAIADRVSPAVLYQYILLPEVETEFTLKTESRSGTFPQGNYADMASIEVPYAPIEKQSEISITLARIRQTIALNLLENLRLSELRDTLLPKLISGEIDVSNLDI